MRIRSNPPVNAIAFVCLLVPALAHARPDPLDPAAPVPPLTHSSPLSAPAALSDTSVGSWRNANETVNRIGGWRVYGREAPGASGSATPPTTPLNPAPAVPPPAHRHP